MNSSTLDNRTQKAIALYAGYLVERYGGDYCANLSQKIHSTGLDKTPIGQEFADRLDNEGQSHREPIREPKMKRPDPDFDAFVEQWYRSHASYGYGEVL